MKRLLKKILDFFKKKSDQDEHSKKENWGI